MKLMRLLMAFTLLATLAACSTLSPKTPHSLWAFEGKFSLRSPQKNQTGYIQWQQYPQHFEMKLWGTLGLGTVRINGNQQGAVVDNGKQQQHYQTHELISLLPGVSIPLAAFIEQMQNLPQHTHVGSPEAITGADNWHIETLRVDADGRPSKIRIIQTHPDQTTQLMILIKKWL